MTWSHGSIMACLVFTASACGDEGTASTDAPVSLDTSNDDSQAMDQGEPMPFELTSSAFAEGETIELRYECGPPLVPGPGPGENISPPLAWTAGPIATGSYALVMRDLDAGNLVHWVLYDIPASNHEVEEHVPAGYQPRFPAGAKQAELQGSGYFGYFGPCSPGRVNTYQWTLHALPMPELPDVDRTSTENDLARAVENASIASASLSGES